MTQNLLIMGPRPFAADNASSYEYKGIQILYNERLDSCKLIIPHSELAEPWLVIPKQGGFGVEHLVLVTDAVAAIFEEFGYRELAGRILAASSRFMIGRETVPGKVHFA